MNRKILYILTLNFMFITFGLLAQGTWEHEYDPFNMDGYSGEDVVKCSDGGYAFNGSCYIEDPQNPGSSLENYGFTMKVDIEGNLEWAKKDTVSFIPMNQGSALVQTSDGGFITAVIPWLSGQGALIKRDAEGHREWVINPDMWIYSLDSTYDGNVIAAGASTSGDLKKITLEGVILWEKPTPGIFYSVSESSDGSLLTSGWCLQNSADVYISKRESNGDTLWTKTYDNLGDDEGKCIFETLSGEIIVVGRFDWAEGFIWKLNQSGITLDLEIVDSNIGKAIWSGNEFNNTIITWGSSSNYIPRFNRFDSDLNFIDTMPSSCSVGDKAFVVEGEYLIFCKLPNITITKTLFEPVAVYENIFPQLNHVILTNYPNPFNPSTTINYTISESGFINISVYNIKGQKIKSLINELKPKGNYNIYWDGHDQNERFAGSGIYFINLKMNSRLLKTHKILLIK